MDKQHDNQELYTERTTFISDLVWFNQRHGVLTGHQNQPRPNTRHLDQSKVISPTKQDKPVRLVKGPNIHIGSTIPLPPPLPTLIHSPTNPLPYQTPHPSIPPPVILTYKNHCCRHLFLIWLQKIFVKNITLITPVVYRDQLDYYSPANVVRSAVLLLGFL